MIEMEILEAWNMLADEHVMNIADEFAAELYDGLMEEDFLGPYWFRGE